MLSLSLYQLFVLLGMGQALFLAYMLAGRRNKGQGEGILALIMVLMAAEMAYSVYYEAALYRQYPAWIGFDACTYLLYGPLLWLFMRRLAQEPLPFGPRLLLHFLPALLVELGAVISYAVNPLQLDFVALLDQQRDVVSVGFQFEPLAFASEVQIGAYLWACWRVLAHYRSRIQAERADEQSSGLPWMRQVLAVYSGLWLLLILRDQLGLDSGLSSTLSTGLSLALAATVFFIAHQIWQQRPRQLLLSVSLPLAAPAASTMVMPAQAAAPALEQEVEEEVAAPKYAKSALDVAAASLLFAELEQLMAGAEPWREPELDLGSLAGSLGVAPHYLSQTINSCGSGNFYDYVNGYRVRAVSAEFKRAGASAAVLATAFAAGFNSKSAFYSAFKRHTGTTPKAFLLALALNKP